MADLNETKQCILDAFKELEWKYECKDLEEKCRFQIGLQLDNDAKLSKILFVIDVQKDSILFISTCDIKANTENINRMAEFICRANWGMLNGNFEYNYDNGYIRYKIFIDTNERQINKQEIITSLIISAEMWSTYGNGLMEILGSIRPVKNIIESIEQSIFQRE